jgi:hypothetical protein
MFRCLLIEVQYGFLLLLGRISVDLTEERRS